VLELTFQGQPIDDHASYLIACSGFMASGGDDVRSTYFFCYCSSCLLVFVLFPLVVFSQRCTDLSDPSLDVSFALSIH
jgi:hypothetical protein